MVHRLAPGDDALFAAMLDLFGEVFAEVDFYGANRPDPAYVDRLLGNYSFVALVALDAGRVIGALTAYRLDKYEQARSEYYIYDLAVAHDRRRQGLATRLIEALKPIARANGAWVIFVQADYGDDPAIALYTKLGIREDVMHFDLRLD
jgi:aminoglycoside 3-N-acetyltransferase I